MGHVKIERNQMVDNPTSSQEGPLAQYPAFALVDEQQKWRRVQDWIRMDSLNAIDNSPHPENLLPSILEASERCMPQDELFSNCTDLLSPSSSVINNASKQDPARIQEINQYNAAVDSGVLTEKNLHRGLRESVQKPASNLNSTSVQDLQHAVSSRTHQDIRYGAARRGSDQEIQVDAMNEGFAHDIQMRHALEVGQLQSQIEALQQAFENECLHSARVSQQLQAELLHVRSLTDAEAAARASESSLQERLERTKKAFDSERQRSVEASQTFELNLKEHEMKMDALQELIETLEVNLQGSDDINKGLRRDLDVSLQRERVVLDKMSVLEHRCKDYEQLLDSSSTEVDVLRKELQGMRTKQEARDKRLLQHVEDVEERQIGALQEALHQSKAQNQDLLIGYNSLRAALISCSGALSPASLSAVLLGASDAVSLRAFEEPWGGPEGYNNLHGRLLGMRCITVADSQQVVMRLDAFLSYVKTAILDAERKEAASKAEMDLHVSTLQEDIQACRQSLDENSKEYQVKVSALSAALSSATQRVDELLQELLVSSQKAALADELQKEVERCHHAQQQLELNASQALMLEREAIKAQQVLTVRDVQLAEITKALDEARLLLSQSEEGSKLKEERLMELRDGLCFASVSHEEDVRQLQSKLLKANTDLAAVNDEIQAMRHLLKVSSEEALQLTSLNQDLESTKKCLEEELQESQRESLQAAAELEEMRSSIQQCLKSVLKSFKEKEVFDPANAADDHPLGGQTYSDPEHNKNLQALLLQVTTSHSTLVNGAHISLVITTMSECCTSVMDRLRGSYNRQSEFLDQAKALVQSSITNLTCNLENSTSASHHLDETQAACLSSASSQTCLIALLGKMSIFSSSANQRLSDLAERNHLQDKILGQRNEELANFQLQMKTELTLLNQEASQSLKAASEDYRQLQEQLGAERKSRETALLQVQVTQSELNSMRDIVSNMSAEHLDNTAKLAEKLAVLEEMQVENTGLQLSLADKRHQLECCTASVRRSYLMREHAVYRLSLLRRHATYQRRVNLQVSKQLQNLKREKEIGIKWMSQKDAQLHKLSTEVAQYQSTIADQAKKIGRAENLLPKIEERRHLLEEEKKELVFRVETLTSKLTTAMKDLDLMRHSNLRVSKQASKDIKWEQSTAARQIAAAEERASRAECQVQELVHQLEEAEQGLRHSFNTATKLQKDCEDLRVYSQSLQDQLDLHNIHVKNQSHIPGKSMAVGCEEPGTLSMVSAIDSAHLSNKAPQAPIFADSHLVMDATSSVHIFADATMGCVSNPPLPITRPSGTVTAAKQGLVVSQDSDFGAPSSTPVVSLPLQNHADTISIMMKCLSGSDSGSSEQVLNAKDFRIEELRRLLTQALAENEELKFPSGHTCCARQPHVALLGRDIHLDASEAITAVDIATQTDSSSDSGDVLLAVDLAHPNLSLVPLPSPSVVHDERKRVIRSEETIIRPSGLLEGPICTNCDPDYELPMVSFHGVCCEASSSADICTSSTQLCLTLKQLEVLEGKHFEALRELQSLKESQLSQPVYSSHEQRAEAYQGTIELLSAHGGSSSKASGQHPQSVDPVTRCFTTGAVDLYCYDHHYNLLLDRLASDLAEALTDLRSSQAEAALALAESEGLHEQHRLLLHQVSSLTVENQRLKQETSSPDGRHIRQSLQCLQDQMDVMHGINRDLWSKICQNLGQNFINGLDHVAHNLYPGSSRQTSRHNRSRSSAGAEVPSSNSRDYVTQSARHRHHNRTSHAVRDYEYLLNADPSWGVRIPLEWQLEQVVMERDHLRDALLSLCHEKASRNFNTQLVDSIRSCTTVASRVIEDYSTSSSQVSVMTIAGPCAVNASAICKQELMVASTPGFRCFEHASEHPLSFALEYEIKGRQETVHKIHCLESDLSLAMLKIHELETEVAETRTALASSVVYAAGCVGPAVRPLLQASNEGDSASQLTTSVAPQESKICTIFSRAETQLTQQQAGTSMATWAYREDALSHHEKPPVWLCRPADFCCSEETLQALLGVVKGIEAYAKAREEEISQQCDNMMHSAACHYDYVPAAVKQDDAQLDLLKAMLYQAEMDRDSFRNRHNVLQEQIGVKNLEIRELNNLLQAWEAMRLGKDAQIASLIERNKRNEEANAEKSRTIEALRRQIFNAKY
ncbi:hypothetical protein CEUSTIGMA_g11334.t1 [Chlamydomonas eustigma]|uniref:Uncharacterized protein n=1 Tax=Chlamydomonas eustigma TaxID=1157962 RepID=A0A250XM95_9CHLO|nr:hypothetical protein CEUSTIGMA_g11334.t1 [Chlamydomonas eustigma]|eukprot:GAX83910.1 hypothetical protein CEUSTIGMA_g11334.t1 [Chlamydomonas eustigma]